MGVVCAKSLKQIKLQNTPVITTRLVFICFFLKKQLAVEFQRVNKITVLYS